MINKINLLGTMLTGCFFKFRYRKGSYPRKNIIIYFPQQIGDVILFLATLNKISQKYSDNYNLYFLARQSVVSFLKDNMDVDSKVNLVEIDVERIKYDCKYVNTLSLNYMTQIDKFIVPNYSMTGLLFALRLSCEKVCMISDLSYNSSWFIRFIYCNVFNNVVFVSQDMMELVRYKFLLQALNIVPDSIKMPTIMAKNRQSSISLIKSRYCVVSIGASLPEKIWSMKRFSEIIFYITTKRIDVYVCGNKTEVKLQKKLEQYINGNTNHIKLCVGQTSMNEWVDLIQNAEFVIGNDSASIHIAAACKIPSICLCGSYDKNQFFPYVVEEESTVLPIVIRKNMPCEYCRAKGKYFGYGNKKCQKYIRENTSSLCIAKISVTDVIGEIDNLLKYKLNINLMEG